MTYPWDAYADGEKAKVIVSIVPLADFVEAVGRGKVDVSVMIPPGGNPHTYGPTPGQMKEVSRADLYVKVGTDIEFEILWMDKLIALNEEMLICDASKGIKLIVPKEHYHTGQEGHHHHGSKDPHTWLSPVNAIIMVGNIRDALIKIDPENKEYYITNARDYIVELNRLNIYIKDKLAKINNKTFMVFHPAWGYYAADYGLEELSVEYRGKGPTPKQMAGLINKAKSLGIKVIFAYPAFSRKSADTIARGIGGRVEFIDPLAKDYINNLKKVTNALVAAE